MVLEQTYTQGMEQTTSYPSERGEMHAFSEMTARPAPSTGGLAHHGMTCSCGFEAVSTMPTLVAQYAREHVAYFAPEAVASRARRAARKSR